MTLEQKEKLLNEIGKLHHRYELSKTVGPDYYEPGMMEYLDQYDGRFDEETGQITLRFEVKGTRYEGRIEQIEKIEAGDKVLLIRESENTHNPNNFAVHTVKDNDIGNMPAELCNALAPIYDEGSLIITESRVSYVEPISKRSRFAKQAILFVELSGSLLFE